MAAVTSSQVSYVSGYEVGDRQNKLVYKRLVYDVTFSGNGGTADDCPASLFGLTTILSATALFTNVSSNLRWFVVQVELDGAGILTFDPTVAADANRGSPANITGVVRVELLGY